MTMLEVALDPATVVVAVDPNRTESRRPRRRSAHWTEPPALPASPRPGDGSPEGRRWPPYGVMGAVVVGRPPGSRPVFGGSPSCRSRG